MKVLKAILLVSLPILIIVGMYRWYFGDKEMFGFQRFMDYISTFNGLQSTINMFTNLTDVIHQFNSLETPSVLDYLQYIWEMLKTAFLLPFTFTYDVLSNVVWFIKMFAD